VAATAAVVLIAAGAAPGAERPGAVDRRLALFNTARIEGLDVGADGRIVVAGREPGYPGNHPWVRAYLPDGTPDPSFSGDGLTPLADDNRSIAGALIQPDGRVVVAQNGYFSYPPAPHLVRRLTADGNPDPSFGDDGVIEPSVGSELSDLALQPDGRLVVAGSGHFYPDDDVIFVRRYLADGSPDSGFGSTGLAALPAGAGAGRPAVALQPGGGLLITLQRSDGAAIARLTPDGGLDSSFGAGGLAPVQMARPRLQHRLMRRSFGPGPRAVVLPDGRIRVPVTFDMPSEQRYRIALVGLTDDGRPDREYGELGLALGPRPAPAGEVPDTSVADPRGGVVVAGVRYSDEEFAGAANALIRRFRADGNFDRSFGDNGVVLGATPPPGYAVFEQELAFSDADTLVAAEHAFDGKYSLWGAALLRVLHAGYDLERPSIAIAVRGCRSIGVRISDLSALERVVVRSGRRIVRRTHRKRFRVRVAAGAGRISVHATDVAGNRSRATVRLPRC
jgi:uncharacterized delta-60 repeat protein